MTPLKDKNVASSPKMPSKKTDSPIT